MLVEVAKVGHGSLWLYGVNLYLNEERSISVDPAIRLLISPKSRRGIPWDAHWNRSRCFNTTKRLGRGRFLPHRQRRRTAWSL